VLLPFPEPDGVAPLLFGAGLTPADWRALYEQARRRVLAVSPDTRIGARISGLGDESRALADRWPPRPRWSTCSGAAAPGQRARRRARARRRGARDVGPLARRAGAAARAVGARAGLSPLAYGEAAQARFLEGCIARASARDDVEGLLVEGWTRPRTHARAAAPRRQPARGCARVAADRGRALKAIATMPRP
jgi:hypothetical protein